MNRDKCSSLEEVRNQIDQIDQSVIELLAARQYYVDQAVRFKHSIQDIQSPERVEQVIAKVRMHATEARVDPDLIEKLYRDMLHHFIQRELKEIRP